MTFRVDPSADVDSFQIRWVYLDDQLHVHVVPGRNGYTSKFLRGKLEVGLDRGRTTVGLEPGDKLTLGLD